MATFHVCVRSRNKLYNTVYIRIVQKGKPDYIKTSWLVTTKQLNKFDVKDNTILIQAHAKIKEYIDRLNTIDTTNWDVKRVKEFLLYDGTDVSFTDYARQFILKKSLSSANGYKSAITSLQKHLRKENIFFVDITSQTINSWIEELKHTADAKKKYPVLIKTIFTAGQREINDYDAGMLIIKHNPFINVKIPNSDIPKKRSLTREVINEILNYDVSQSQKSILAPQAQDVAKLVLYLAGINTVDLYNLKKTDLKGEKLCYNRTKTKDRREDKSYFEITVPYEIKQLFEKYKGKKNLFDFSERYYTPEQFNKMVNRGLKDIGAAIGLENLTTYYFRHSWSNIAANQVGATDEDIAFCLNHASAHKVTQRYINKNFNRVDIINRKVIDYLNEK